MFLGVVRWRQDVGGQQGVRGALNIVGGNVNVEVVARLLTHRLRHDPSTVKRHDAGRDSMWSERR